MNQNWIDKARNAEQGYEIPVSDKLWTRIQEVRVQEKKKQLRIVWLKRSAVTVTVAASFAAIVCLNIPWGNNDAVIGELELKSQSDKCVMYDDGKIINDNRLVLAQMQEELGAFGAVSNIVDETMEDQLSEMSVIMED